jgi:hypothetical protein
MDRRFYNARSTRGLTSVFVSCHRILDRWTLRISGGFSGGLISHWACRSPCHSLPELGVWSLHDLYEHLVQGPRPHPASLTPTFPRELHCWHLLRTPQPHLQHVRRRGEEASSGERATVVAEWALQIWWVHIFLSPKSKLFGVLIFCMMQFVDGIRSGKMFTRWVCLHPPPPPMNWILGIWCFFVFAHSNLLRTKCSTKCSCLTHS